MNVTHSGPKPGLQTSAERDLLSRIALGAAAISLIGFAVLCMGHLVDPSVFNNSKHPGTANNVAFFAYVIGLLIALFLGGAVWLYGKRTHHPRALAKLAASYGILFLIVGIVIAALGG